MSFAVLNGRVLLEDQDKVEVRNLLVQGTNISGVGYIPDEDEETLSTFDATKGMVVSAPSDFIYAPRVADLESVLEQVLVAGVQQVMLLPSTASPLDTPERVRAMQDAIPEDYKATTFIACSASLENRSDQLSEVSLMATAGAVAVYMDRMTEHEQVFKQALTYIDMIGCPIIFGPATTMVANNAHLNEGDMSFKIGIKGESEQTELQCVQQILGLVSRHTSVPVHFHALSSAHAVAYVYTFKETYPNLSVGVSPFHLLLSDTHLETYNPLLKFNPPLRSQKTGDDLIALLKKGCIDHLPSLHCPVQGDMQAEAFPHASFGQQTIGNYYHVVAHVFASHSIPKEQYQGLLNFPQHLGMGQVPVLDLKGQAMFSVLSYNPQHQQPRSVRGVADISTVGGLVASVKHGTLITHDISNPIP
jgi:dihydroorotase-like cyclic amidohydrolase